MVDCLESVTKDGTKIIYEQMSNSIGKIKEKDEICIFAYIKYDNKNIPVIIINNHKFQEKNNMIKISLNNEIKTINLEDIKYINKEYDLKIIEIKENKDDNIKFLEIDNNLYDRDSEINYDKKSIYMINYNNKNDISVSYGLINYINQSELIYLKNKNLILNGSPIFNLSNNKLLGIHQKQLKYYNRGIFFKNIIKEFIIKYKCNMKRKKYYESNNNEINILIKVDKEEIDQKIYFMDNYEYKDENNETHFHDNLKELNEFNTELYIKNEKKKYKKYFIPKEEGKYNIKLKFNINLTDCSYMFAGCKNIININFIKFNSINITNMKFMFYQCNIENINLLSFDTKNVKYMNSMFYNCKNLNKLDLSSFDIKNVSDINRMFYGSSSLKSLPDISKWNTINVTNIQAIFYECKLLEYLPDISKWDTKKVTLMNHIFYGCSSLKSLPDISKWNTTNVTNIQSIFCGCSSLKSLPDISKWVTKKVDNMSYIFYGCSSLKSLPDISKWDLEQITKKNDMFTNCLNLKNIPKKFK